MKTANCRACGKPIAFLKTTHGTTMPVDLTNVSDNDTIYDKSRHRSHFSSCENSKYFKKRGGNGSSK